MYNPKWTGEIHDEWIRSLLSKRADLQRKDLERTRAAMDSAFPVAEITNYKKIINNLSLPDQNDRHILAAAIKAKAEIIVTFNLKDFPPDYLSKYGISPLHPDQFILELIIKDKKKVSQALSNQVHHLKKPPQSKETVLQILGNCGLKKTVKKLKE